MRAIRSKTMLGVATALLASSLMTPAAAGAAPAAPAAPPANSAPQHQARLPNVVLILADDLGVEGVNSYGGEYYTPNIDALARDGVSFDNAHAMPECTPTRVRMLTGKENHRNYEAFGYLNPKERTFGNAMKEAGYVTGIVGKWQLGGNGFDGRVGITPQQAGFDESLLWQLQSTSKGSRYWGPTLAENGRTRIFESGFGPDRESDFALDFIQRHKDQPFFLYIPTVLVHSPFVTTPDTPNAKDPKDRFSGMVTYLDMLVGRVTAKLKTLGLDDNTVVIFTGDNGTNKQITTYRNGAAVEGGKATSTIRGTQVPMIVRWPGKFPAGQRREGLFDLMDVYPTVAEIAGQPVPKGSIDGVSQLSVITGQRSAARDWIFMHYAPRWPVGTPARFVFDSHWKLYGDGTFVSLDPVHSSEQQIQPKPGSPGAKRLHEFQKIMANMNDGPLSEDRFPMCIGKPSLDPQVPAIRAGCPNLREAAGAD